MNNFEFIKGLMKENTNELGFIPSTTLLDRYIRMERYLIQEDKGKPLGYLLHGSLKAGKILTVAQAVIEYDFRAVGFGHDLVNRLIDRAKSAGSLAIHLRCAEDLESNLFWKSMGFQQIAILMPDNRRRRALNVFELILDQSGRGRQLSLFDDQIDS